MNPTAVSAISKKREGRTQMKRIMVVMLGLCAILSSCSSASPKLQIELEGQSVDFMPMVRELGNYSGSFFDSSADRFPYLEISNKTNVSFYFLEKPPSNVSVTMYEVYDTSIAFGATTAHGEPVSIEFEYKDNRISFDVGEGEERHHLYVCSCDWNSLFSSTSRNYVFVTENAEDNG